MCQSIGLWKDAEMQYGSPVLILTIPLKYYQYLGRKAITNLDHIFKSTDVTLLTKIHLVKIMVFPVVMYGCESWTIKKAEHKIINAFELWCWRRLLRVPWTQGVQTHLVHPKGNQFWIFIGRTDVKAETSILWPPDVKSWLIWKNLDAGIDWRQEEKGTSEDEMVGWHNFEQAPGIGDRQRSLLCYSPWGCKESDMTEWLNRTDTNKLFNFVNLLSFLGLVPNRWEEIRWPPGTFKLLWSKINEENLA